MQKIVVFASGNGTNAEKIILHFKKSSQANVVGVFSNNPRAKVLQKAESHDVDIFVFDKQGLNEGFVLNELDKIQPDLIVLAGFLLKFPEHIINAYPNKVINVHPALLPKYGGKGMYGNFVHETVIANKETESGITIHYVNENYDEGAIIFQAKTTISSEDNPQTLAEKIHELEHKYFPEVIAKILK